MNTKKIFIIGAGIVIIVGGLCFWGGAYYANNRTYANFDVGMARSQSGVSFQARSIPGVKNDGSFLNGRITALDANMITLQTSDGGSKLVLYATSTSIKKTEQGVIGDISTGTVISVMGTKNNDGSITAKTIQIDPQGVMPEQKSGQFVPQNSQ